MALLQGSETLNPHKSSEAKVLLPCVSCTFLNAVIL